MCPRLGMGDANPARRSVGFRSGFVFGSHLTGFVSVAFIPCGWSISFMNIGLWTKICASRRYVRYDHIFTDTRATPEPCTHARNISYLMLRKTFI